MVSAPSVLVAARRRTPPKLAHFFFRSLFLFCGALLIDSLHDISLYSLYSSSTDYVVVSASFLSFAHVFWQRKQSNICPVMIQNTSSTSHHGHRDMHFVHKLSQAVAASEDLRCPSVYTLCLMQPCRPPSMHMGSM